VRILLAGGANPNINDCRGKSPLFIALKNKHLKLANLLISMGATRDGLTLVCFIIITIDLLL